jgi:hypothetical protein
MSTRGQLNSYIEQIKRRLLLGAVLRGAAVFTSAALVATVILVLITNIFAFSPVSITSARVALFLALAVAIGLGLAIPIYGLDHSRAAGKAEAAFPQFQQRLLTFAERGQGARNPFLDLLAEDTLRVAHSAEPSRLVSAQTLMASVAAGVASLAILIWMVIAGPGFLGHGAALLWVGTSHAGPPIYDLRVAPGDAAVRRNTNQLVTAQLTGIQPGKVTLYARYQSASKWEQVAMQPQDGAPGFQFLFAGLPENVEYYVEAGPLTSKHFNIRVVDVPGVKQIRVTYRYPSWTGLQNVVEERGGDLRAYEGTQADLEILMDRPLRDGLLVVDGQDPVQLSGGEGNVYKGTVRIDKDGLYHVAALDKGQQVRLSDDYFIEARKANPPEIRVSRPGRDYQASPIEEVTIAAGANGDFGLNDLSVHYSVNGGPEQTVDLLKQKGVKQADGATTLALEDFKLVPGDVVSFYATAKDAHSEARSDIFFIEAQPFEREFSQSQAAGGGGGGGGGGANDQAEISQRQKEIIAATWKQEGDKSATKQAAAENGRFLSGVQSKLRDQALSLAGRLERRELSDANQEFSDFQKDMNAAAEAMNPAADKLGAQKWTDAIPNEQRALQHLLRAEATFRQITVAFGARGGGGGGGGAGRDLASLFDLELDTEKNQYETGQSASSQDQRQKDIDDTLQKLEQLAQRQQELADQQQNAQNAEQQRWQQEMLRREAEELQRQMEQLARNGQQGQQGQQGQGQQGQQGQQGSASGQGQSGQSSGSGGQGSADSRVQQALDQVRQANEDMRRAGSSQQSAADQRRAAERLKEAENLLNGLRQQNGSGQLDATAREADRLAQEEKQEADRMKQMFGQGTPGADGQPQPGQSGRQQAGAGSSASPQDQAKLAEERERTAQDYANLEKQIQDAERNLASSQRDAATKLRDALGEAQQNDLRDRLQKSADWLRQGLGAYSNQSEPDIASGLQRLSDQVRQAQQALNNAQPGNDQQNLQTALDRVERLRNQMDSLSRDPNGQQGQQGQPGQGQPGQGQQAGNQAGGQRGGSPQGGPGQAAGGNNNGVANGFRDGAYGGAYGQGRQYGGYDTGGQILSGSERQAAPPPTAEEMQRAYQNALSQLNQLRQDVRDQPEPLADIQDLIRQMQQLDPSRFPGNPALVEQLHTQVLNTMDKVELQLRRELDDKEPGQIRSGDSLTVPPGYQESVAEYFRRLSKKQQQQ